MIQSYQIRFGFVTQNLTKLVGYVISGLCETFRTLSSPTRRREAASWMQVRASAAAMIKAEERKKNGTVQNTGPFYSARSRAGSIMSDIRPVRYLVFPAEADGAIVALGGSAACHADLVFGVFWGAVVQCDHEVSRAPQHVGKRCSYAGKDARICQRKEVIVQQGIFSTAHTEGILLLGD